MSPGPLAIFPWGEVIESFLDPLGLTAADFAERMRGGWLFGYVRALARQGRGSVIVYASERVDQPTRLTHAETGAPIWLVPGRRSGGGLTRAWPSAAALQQWRRTPLAAFATVLRREGCTAILAQDYEHPRFDALVVLARALQLPIYASFQGGDVTLSQLERAVRRRSLLACRGLVVASHRERVRLAQRYRAPAEMIADTPNPVDVAGWTAEPRQQARAALGLPHDAFVVLNHGRIDIWRKGLDVLVEAWRHVAAAAPDARLVVLGSGQDREAFAALAVEVPSLTWVADYVTDPPLVRRWLSAADAYVTLSRIEGMPVAPLEAMACGLPLVASDAHGLADIFQGREAAGGQLVPREDPRAAAEAILALHASPGLRARLGAAARETVERCYDLEPVGRALAAALAGGRPGAAQRLVVEPHERRRLGD